MIKIIFKGITETSKTAESGYKILKQLTNINKPVKANKITGGHPKP